MINNLLLSESLKRIEQENKEDKVIYIYSLHEHIYITEQERHNTNIIKHEHTQTHQEVGLNGFVCSLFPSVSDAYFFFGSGFVNDLLFLLYYLNNRVKLIEWFNHSTIGIKMYMILASINRRKNAKVKE